MSSDNIQKSWFSRLKEGLSASSNKVVSGITGIFTEKRLDEETLEQLEDLLISSDLGVNVASRLIKTLSEHKFDKQVSDREVRETFAKDIELILEPVAKPILIEQSLKPHVILVCGVNGSGKTTTIGKLAQQWKAEGKSVCLAAGDTFRAAAIEQLKVWGERTQTPVIIQPQGTDPAAVAYDAVKKSIDDNHDVLIIDTAGRLQNRAELMDELAKIVRVIQKTLPEAPHNCLLVLDGTVGQNAHSQVATFKEMVNVTGLIVTKLDGSARGGIIVALAEKFALPVHAVGVGEAIEDLRAFDPKIFAQSLMGLD
jgi:fused signal recognition particle receptor